MSDELKKAEDGNPPAQNLLELLPIAGPIFSGSSLAYTVTKDVSRVLGANPGKPLVLQILESTFITEQQQHRLLLKLVSGSLHGIVIEALEFEFGWGPIQALKIDSIEFQHYNKGFQRGSYTQKNLSVLDLDTLEDKNLPSDFPVSIPSGSFFTFYAYLNEIERKNLAKESGGEIVVNYAQLNNAKSSETLKSQVRLVWQS